MVVARRSWRFGGADLPEGMTGQQGYKPAKLTGMLTRAGLPRYLFAKTPAEPKPFYIDLRAPHLVANLARAWRQLPAGAELELQEMLPGPEQLWLADARNQHYTAELRLIAVDQAAGPATAGNIVVVDITRIDDLNRHLRREDEPSNVCHRGNQTVSLRLRQRRQDRCREFIG